VDRRQLTNYPQPIELNRNPYFLFGRKKAFQLQTKNPPSSGYTSWGIFT
jgi:hypothetical protein